jgi:hypothetical protein
MSNFLLPSFVLIIQIMKQLKNIFKLQQEGNVTYLIHKKYIIK